MTDAEINVAIAEACGWENVQEEEYPHRWLWRKGEEGSELFDEPDDYCGDLNAMHEAEKALTTDQQRHYGALLLFEEPHVRQDVATDRCGFRAAHTPALQRAEVFLKTLGKWKEQP